MKHLEFENLTESKGTAYRHVWTQKHVFFRFAAELRLRSAAFELHVPRLGRWQDVCL